MSEEKNLASERKVREPGSNMREVNCESVTSVLKDAVLKAVTVLPDDIRQGLEDAKREEKSDLAGEVLDALAENWRLAERHHVPLCQDTGMLCAYVRIGQDVRITGGSLTDAINKAVREAYCAGFLRKSICSPIDRLNTGDNTPALIDWEVVAGDGLTILIVPKGGGCENMGKGAVLKPGDGLNGVKEFILQAVRDAGSAPCPPYVLGVGVGGNFESCARLSKIALYKDIREPNPDAFLDGLERELKCAINALGIGAAGAGGSSTCLRIRIETAPTHITSLPVFVSFGCNSMRKVTVSI